MAEEVTKENAPQSSGFDIKIILIGLLVFLVTVGASFFLMQRMISPLMPQDSGSGSSVRGELLSVGEFTTNIGDIGGNRYVKVEVYLEISDKKHQEEAEKAMPIIKDSILSILASKTVADLSVHNRENLKNEMRDTINKNINSKIVTSVYFTNLILQ